MIVEMNKKYYANGSPVRILCTDSRDPEFPVQVLDANGRFHGYDINGRHQSDSALDLVEVNETPLSASSEEEKELIYMSHINEGKTSEEAFHAMLVEKIYYSGICSIE
jgi:hypothetical protein